MVEQTVIESKGHTEVTDKGYDATCTEDGLTDGKHCSVCNEVLAEQTVIESKGHTEVTDKGYEATCTEDGLTDGKHCSVCNEVLVEQTIIESQGHSEVTDKGYNATCTEDGLTDGKHCSVCNEVLVEQTIIESQGHTEVTDKGYNATCTEDGLTDGKHCSTCNEVLVEQTVIESKGHTEVIDPAKEPTCTEIGWTEAKICQICELVLSERTYIRKMGHNVVDGDCIRCDYQRIDFTDISIYFSDYGYNYLGTLTNGEKMQELYNRFDVIAREFHSNSVTSETLDKITCSDLGLKLEDCRMAFSRFIYDRPIYYWLTGSYNYSYNTSTNVITGITLTVAPEYSSGATRAEYNSIIYKGAEEFYSTVETEESIYNTVLAYYDLIISKINYAYDSNGDPEDSIWAHRIVGVFSEQGVVCEGYAKTLQLMLNVSKISNIYISGDAGGGHAWSLVRLDDGKWYWFDSTWDDSGDQYSDWLAGKQYFALVDTSVDLKDRVFIDSHVPTIDNNWGWPSLPERAEASFDDADIVEALQTFTVGENTYQVVGYYKVHLIKSTVSSGTAIVPDSVFYEGDFYDVIGSGTLRATGQVVFDIVFDYYSISELTFTDGIVRIQGINNCKRLTTVRIPKSTKYIIMNAFAYCNNLTTIYYDGTVEEWNAIEKGSDWNIGCGTITVYCSDGNVTV